MGTIITEIPGKSKDILMINTTNSAGSWVESTLVDSAKAASNVMKLRYHVPMWPGHLAGQHVDVRLTSSDGYIAERSYSIANPPGDGDVIELGVELLEDGEVSPYLWAQKPGDKIEIRGPIGGHFIWKGESDAPLVLVAGGAGMVPLMSMLRHEVRNENKDRVIIFIISIRTIDRLLYEKELEMVKVEYPNVKIVVTLTESIPDDWKGYSRRVDHDMFESELSGIKSAHPEIFVCGPTKFVEAAAKILLEMSFDRETIKTERFGG